MTPGRDEPDDVTSTMWTSDGEEGVNAFDEDCSPTRVCRNAREFSFEGIAVDGGDLKTAWRETLEREGKLSRSGETIRDLVLGQAESD